MKTTINQLRNGISRHDVDGFPVNPGRQLHDGE